MTASALEIKLLNFMRVGGDDRARKELLIELRGIAGTEAEKIDELKKLIKKAITEIEALNEDQLFGAGTANKRALFNQFKRDLFNVKKVVYRDNGAGGVDEDFFKTSLTLNSLAGPTGAFNSLLHIRYEAYKHTAPAPIGGRAELEFEDEIEDPAPIPNAYVFGRMARAQSKSSDYDRLVDPINRVLAEANIADVMTFVQDKLQGKSDKDRSVATGPRDEDMAGVLKRRPTDGQDFLISASKDWDAELVFQGKIKFNQVNASCLEVSRTSHHDGLDKIACTVKQDAPNKPICISVSSTISNAPSRITMYTDEHDDYDFKHISDEAAMKAVLKETIRKTSESLQGTKIDHRFCYVRIRDDHGDIVSNALTNDQILTLLNNAIIALPGVIPKFDPDVIRVLDAKMGAGAAPAGGITASMQEDYQKIREIQREALETPDAKTAAALDRAYGIFADWNKYKGHDALQDKKRANRV